MIKEKEREKNMRMDKDEVMQLYAEYEQDTEQFQPREFWEQAEAEKLRGH